MNQLLVVYFLAESVICACMLLTGNGCVAGWSGRLEQRA